MRFNEFKKEMKKFGKSYEYVGFIEDKGRKVRGYQEFINNGMTSVGEPITSDHFQAIVDYYNDMSEHLI